MTPRNACATNFGTVDAIEALEVAGDVFSIRTGWIRAIQLRFGPLCRVAEVWTFLLAGIGHTNHVDRTQRLWRSHIHGGCCRGCSSLRLRNRRRNPHRAFIRASSRSAVEPLEQVSFGIGGGNQPVAFIRTCFCDIGPSCSGQ